MLVTGSEKRNARAKNAEMNPELHGRTMAPKKPP